MNSIQFAFFTAKEYLCDFVAGRQLRKCPTVNTPPPAACGTWIALLLIPLSHYVTAPLKQGSNSGIGCP